MLILDHRRPQTPTETFFLVSMSGTRLPRKDNFEMNEELNLFGRIYMMYNWKDEYMIGDYNISPAMLERFIKYGGLGAIIELDDLLERATSEETVIRVAKIARCENLSDMWRKV